MPSTDYGTYWIVVMGTGLILVFVIAVIGGVVLNQRNKIRHHQEKIRLIESGERRYHDLFQGVSDIVYVHSLDGRMIELNQRGADILSMGVSDVLSRNLADILPPKYRPRVAGYLERLRASSGTVKGYLPYRPGAGGDLMILEYTSSLSHLSNGSEQYVRGIARDVTDLIHSNKALQRMERQTRSLLLASEMTQRKLTFLSHNILQMQEEDRRMIGRELHDEVGQLLVAIGINLDVVRDMVSPKNRTLLERINDTQRITEDILRRVRKVLREYRSIEIEQQGLLPALRSYVDDYSARTGIDVRLIEDDIVETLGYEQKAVIYRIVQESLTNAAKHSRATAVRVTLGCRTDEASLEVADNGVGFDPEKQDNSFVETHLGILGMRERVKIINGRFALDSRIGQGTRIRVDIPLGDADDGPPSPVEGGHESD
jgi:PAS domain S-box-containing protein